VASQTAAGGASARSMKEESGGESRARPLGRRESLRWASAADLQHLAGLCGGYLAAPLWPRRWDRWLVERLFALPLRSRGSQLAQVAARMEELLGPSLQGRDALELARQHIVMRAEEMWARARGLHRDGWRPRIEWQGFRHVHSGLAQGRGVIIWCMGFCGATALKQAFWRAGVPLTHLSRAQHGAPTPSRLGLRWAAPLYCRAENPYLAERAVIPQNGSLTYLKVLQQRLESNACVSVVGELAGRQNVTAPLFGWPFEFATGAPSLAAKTGAALLTAHVRRRDFFDYEVVVSEPIARRAGLGRKVFAEWAVQEFASRLERLIAERPQDWQGWLVERGPWSGRK